MNELLKERKQITRELREDYFPINCIMKRVLHTDQNTSHVCAPISYILGRSALFCLHRDMQTLGPRPHVPIIAATNVWLILLLTFGGIEGQKLSEDRHWRTFIFMITRTHATVCRNKWSIRLGQQHPFHTVVDEKLFLKFLVIWLSSLSHPLTQSLQNYLNFMNPWKKQSIVHNRQGIWKHVAVNILQISISWMHEWTQKWKHEWMMECMHDRINDWMNERMDEGTNT